MNRELPKPTRPPEIRKALALIRATMGLPACGAIGILVSTPHPLSIESSSYGILLELAACVLLYCLFYSLIGRGSRWGRTFFLVSFVADLLRVMVVLASMPGAGRLAVLIAALSQGLQGGAVYFLFRPAAGPWFGVQPRLALDPVVFPPFPAGLPSPPPSPARPQAQEARPRLAKPAPRAYRGIAEILPITLFLLCAPVVMAGESDHG